MFRSSHFIGHLLAAQNVKMQMMNALARVRSAVRYNAESVYKTFAFCYFRYDLEYVSDDLAVFTVYLGAGAYMLARDYKDVSFCLRVYIAESVYEFVLT